MKSPRQILHKRGLNARLVRSLLLAGIICVAVFFSLYYLGGGVLSYYFNHSDFEQKHVEKQVKSLQNYIDKEKISSKNLDRLTGWEKKQPLIFLELYHDQRCIYASPEQATDAVAVDMMETSAHSDWDLHDVKLRDIEVKAFVYSDFYYQYYTIVTVVAFAVTFVLFIFLFLRSIGQLIQYTCQLKEDMEIIEGGALDHEVAVKGDDELTDLAESMNSMRLSFKSQLEQEQVLYQANKKMITQMSHDLRTPLTGLMLYTDIARYHKYNSEEELQGCLDKIDEKAHSIKERSDHIFEYALSDEDIKRLGEHGTDRDVQMITLSCDEAYGEWIGKLSDELKDAGFVIDRDLEWPSSQVSIRPDYLERIGDNIVSNIVKYADRGQAVFIKTVNSERECGLFFSNACKTGVRKTESYGIGLDSIREMMEQMNGICQAHQGENVFELTLLFPCSSDNTVRHA